MNPNKPKPSLFTNMQEELSLTGKALNELLQAVLDKGVPFRFKAKGFSMSPFIKNDDVITVSPLESFSLYPGQIVAFIHPQTRKLNVHRIIKKKGHSYLIKGDNSFKTNGHIPIKNIMGHVTRIERRGKKVHFGLGPERHLIAFFSSRGLLFHLSKPIKKIRSIIKKRGSQYG